LRRGSSSECGAPLCARLRLCRAGGAVCLRGRLPTCVHPHHGMKTGQDCHPHGAPADAAAALPSRVVPSMPATRAPTAGAPPPAHSTAWRRLRAPPCCA
jgi:hypothetical protein